MWIDDLKTVLVNAGVLDTSLILKGSNADIPPGEETYILIRATGGSGNDRTHNSAPQPAYEYPGAQLTVGASDSADAEATAEAAKVALHDIRDEVIGATYYREIRATQEPRDGGPDKNGKPTVKFNVLGCRRPEGVS